MDQSQFEKLGRVTLSWLDYQIDCGREALLGEHSLAQPAGEFLLTHYSGTVMSEFSHPMFAKAKRGRPRQVDYALFSREKELLEFGLEAKWAGRSLPTKQGLTNDVMRLEGIRPVTFNGNDIKGTTNRYFMLAGKIGSVNEVLELGLNKTGITPRPKFLDKFLPVNKTRQTIDIMNIDAPWREYFKSFSEAYTVELPSKMQVRTIFDNAGTHARVLVWKISSVGKRKHFNPSLLTGWSDIMVDETEDPTK